MSQWETVISPEDYPKEQDKEYLAKVWYPDGGGGYAEKIQILTLDSDGLWDCKKGIVMKWALIPEDEEQRRKIGFA